MTIHAAGRRALALPLLLAPALVLAGCGSGPSGPTGESTGAASSEPAASATGDTATLSPAATSGSDETPLPVPTSPADPHKAVLSCSAQLGQGAAAALAKQCSAVSPATHPPCNAANSCAMIEAEIARGCALLGDKADREPACDDPISAASAVKTVMRYYSAINAHDYPTAWAAWGPSGNPEQTYDEFLKGYAQTARTTVSPGKPGRVEGAAGSLYVEVPVTVDAQLDNGRRQHFTGSYTLRQPNRGIAPSQGWHITSAKLSPG